MDYMGPSINEINDIDLADTARKAVDYIYCSQVTLSAPLLLVDGQYRVSTF